MTWGYTEETAMVGESDGGREQLAQMLAQKLATTVRTGCVQTFLGNCVKLNMDWAFVDI